MRGKLDEVPHGENMVRRVRYVIVDGNRENLTFYDFLKKFRSFGIYQERTFGKDDAWLYVRIDNKMLIFKALKENHEREYRVIWFPSRSLLKRLYEWWLAWSGK